MVVGIGMSSAVAVLLLTAACSRLGSAALSGALVGTFAGFLEPVGLALNGDDLGVVDEPIDQRDNAGGIGENLAPLGKGAVGGDHRAPGLVAAGDQFEHQVGMAGWVGGGGGPPPYHQR